MAGEIPLNQQCTFVRPLAQPTLGDSGVASIIYSTHIAAPPLQCLQLVLDGSNYHKWNKFVPRVVMQQHFTSDTATLPSSLSHLAFQADQLLPGTEFCFEVHMDLENESSRLTHLVGSVLQEIEHDGRKGLRVAWRSQGVSLLDLIFQCQLHTDPYPIQNNWFLRAERTQDFILSEDGGTDYYNKETFYGPVAYGIQFLVGDSLKKALEAWKDGLKEEAEAQASALGHSS
jgi:hypothetical protein